MRQRPCSCESTRKLARRINRYHRLRFHSDLLHRHFFSSSAHRRRQFSQLCRQHPHHPGCVSHIVDGTSVLILLFFLAAEREKKRKETRTNVRTVLSSSLFISLLSAVILRAQHPFDSRDSDHHRPLVIRTSLLLLHNLFRQDARPITAQASPAVAIIPPICPPFHLKPRTMVRLVPATHRRQDARPVADHDRRKHWRLAEETRRQPDPR